MIRLMIGRFVISFVLLMPAFAFGADIRILQTPLDASTFSSNTISGLKVTQLSSSSGRFGGISGLVAKDNDFIAITDQGDMLIFEGQKFNGAKILSILGADQKPLVRKSEKDAESLALLPNGDLWIAFERAHRLVRYNDRGFTSGESLDFSKYHRFLGKNSGFEAVETLSNGNVVMIAEGGKRSDRSLLLTQMGPTAWQARDFALTDGFRPTALARIPGSDQLIVLERFFTPLEGVKIRLSYLDLAFGRRGDLIAEFIPPFPIDNMEALIVLPGGRVLMISDDNFSALQRTLLIEFTLK